MIPFSGFDSAYPAIVISLFLPSEKDIFVFEPIATTLTPLDSSSPLTSSACLIFSLISAICFPSSSCSVSTSSKAGLSCHRLPPCSAASILVLLISAYFLSSFLTSSLKWCRPCLVSRILLLSDIAHKRIIDLQQGPVVSRCHCRL